MGKFLIKQTASGGYVFNLLAGNGQVIAVSQTYKARTYCVAGAKSVQVNAPIAAVEDQTVEGYAAAKNPKFEIYTDKKGEFRFRLKARNGQIVASGEGYKEKSSCLNGVESVRKNAAEGKMEDAE